MDLDGLPLLRLDDGETTSLQMALKRGVDVHTGLGLAGFGLARPVGEHGNLVDPERQSAGFRNALRL